MLCRLLILRRHKSSVDVSHRSFQCQADVAHWGNLLQCACIHVLCGVMLLTGVRCCSVLVFMCRIHVSCGVMFGWRLVGRLCVCACVRAYVRACVHVCVCVCAGRCGSLNRPGFDRRSRSISHWPSDGSCQGRVVAVALVVGVVTVVVTVDAVVLLPLLSLLRSLQSLLLLLSWGCSLAF